MSTIGIRVLFVGKSWDVPFDAKACNTVAQLFKMIAKFSPDVIVTSGEAPSSLNVADFNLRKRWIHRDIDDSDADVKDAIERCYYNNIWDAHPFNRSHPLISVFTGTYNTGDVLRDTYQSLRDQTYKNWEWVVVDDESTDGTWEWLLNEANHDHRIRPTRIRHSGKIGFVKDVATRLSYGDYLVELDHDDMLTDNALARIKKEFEDKPDVGMVYSNFAEFYPDGSPHRYGGEFWSDRYREVDYRGKKYAEAIAPDIYDSCGPKYSDMNAWYLTKGPNHVRAFRTSAFKDIGGYNKNLPVADDWDLFVRFFLYHKCSHIDELLYLYRFHDNDENTTRVRFDSIQYHLGLGRRHYRDEFARCCDERDEVSKENASVVVDIPPLRPDIKVIAITYNEMNSIEGFFDQFGHITNDFNILDSGSTDGTVEWARAHGIKVHPREFDQFDVQRNFAVDYFAGDSKDCEWIIMMDPDERLDIDTLANLTGLVDEKSFDIYISPLRSKERSGEYRDFVPKAFLFRNNDSIRWINPVHEKLIGSTKQAIIRNAMITHYIELHTKERRDQMSHMYNDLGSDATLRDDYPILNYVHRDDDRISKIFLGPPISVIIPTYDRAVDLRRAVDSALAQDYLPVEIIVVGDCCPVVNSIPFIESVKVVNLEKNHGAGGAEPRNHGVSIAQSPWIAYLDDDNYWKPNHLSSIMDAIMKSGADMGFSSMQIEDSQKYLICDEPKLGHVDTSMMVHKTSLFHRFGGWKNRDEDGYAHDWQFIKRFLDGGAKWVVTKEPTLIYNAETSGQSKFLSEITDNV